MRIATRRSAAPAVIDAAATGRPPDDYEPLANVVTRQVREAILEGRLMPGIRIRQQELACQFGVSRIPVREALRRLESEGLITVVPHSGARVARMDIAECNELYRVREMIEPMALAESVPNLSKPQLDGLRGLIHAIEASTEDPARWLELDRRFHLDCCAAAPMPRVLAMIEQFWNQTQQYRRAYMATPHSDMFEAAEAEHRLIFYAIEQCDSQDAADRLRSHIRRTRTTLTRDFRAFDAA